MSGLTGEQALGAAISYTNRKVKEASGGDVKREEFEQLQGNVIEHGEAIEALSGEVNELELYKFPNAIIHGDPVINQGQVSGFSADNYLAFPFLVDFGTHDFQIDMAFTTGSDVTNQQNIFDGLYGLALAIKNGHFLMAASSDGASWNIGAKEGTYSVRPNTNYYLKLSFNKLQYKLTYSLDKNTYDTDITIVDTRRPFPVPIYIGVGNILLPSASPTPFKGIINMNFCSVTVAGTVIWNGMDAVGLATRADVSLDNLDNMGIQRIRDIAGSGPEVEHVEDSFGAECINKVEATRTGNTISLFMEIDLTKVPETEYGIPAVFKISDEYYSATRAICNTYYTPSVTSPEQPSIEYAIYVELQDNNLNIYANYKPNRGYLYVYCTYVALKA